MVDGQIRAANVDPVASSTYFTKQRFRNFRLLLEVTQTLGEDYSTMHSAVALLGKRRTDIDEGYEFEGPILMFSQDWGIWDVYGRDRIYPPAQKRLDPIDDAPRENKESGTSLKPLSSAIASA